ncbi:DUF4352 domain-containing protein [bacterium]|nr:DUF4352 domain-containing protein [bacterium]
MAKSESSATKKCRFCQSEIDANASICPNCRKAQKKKFPIAVVLLLVVIGLCGISALGSGGDNKNSGTSSNNETPNDSSKTPASGDFAKPYAKGESVKVGDITWKIVEAKNLGSKLKSTYGGDSCISESGNYIYVKVTATNNTKDMVTVSGLTVYDSEKRELSGASDVFGCIKDQLFVLENINPGISKTLIQVFEAPKDAKGLVFHATDLKFLNVNEAYISLGL